MTPDGDARATIVMTARERHSLTEAALDGIVSDTTGAYRLVYVDCAAPPWLREVLDARAQEWQLDVIRFDEPLWPQEARRRVMDCITTDYVVFIDNDVIVEPGWLNALVRCADETGAGIVGPLYLWGDGVRPPRIHMAGGRLAWSAEEGGKRVLEESHLHANASPREVSITRATCDFAEFHCMLMRTSLLRDDAVLDPAIRCVHEHIDVALAAAARGYPTYVEPAARVTYLAFAEFLLDDLHFLRERWSSAEGESSIAAFCRKWHVLDDARSFGGVRQFVREHVATIDPVRPDMRQRGAAPMSPGHHRQTRSGLLDLAQECGYGEGDLAVLASAFQRAHVLVDGGYRPCGRPFIDHLVGTASVLVHYGFRIDVVVAAMLHAAYTHAPPGRPADAPAIAAGIAGMLGGRDSAVEARVRAYTYREIATGDHRPMDLAAASLLDAEVVAVVGANEIDLHLSGELRYTGRSDVLSDTRMQEVVAVCEVLGVTGLADTLSSARATFRAAAVPLRTHITASYRIAADRRTAVPMTNNVLRHLERKPRAA